MEGDVGSFEDAAVGSPRITVSATVMQIQGPENCTRRCKVRLPAVEDTQETGTNRRSRRASRPRTLSGEYQGYTAGYQELRESSATRCDPAIPWGAPL